MIIRERKTKMLSEIMKVISEEHTVEYLMAISEKICKFYFPKVSNGFVGAVKYLAISMQEAYLYSLSLDEYAEENAREF